MDNSSIVARCAELPLPGGPASRPPTAASVWSSEGDPRWTKQRTSMPDRSAPKQTPVWRVVAVLCLAGTTVSLQQTMVIPLLPGFQELMHISTDNVSWL